MLLSHEPPPAPGAALGLDPAALIPEARRRTRRRRARIVIAGAIVVAGAVLAYLASVPAGRGIVAETSSRPFANVRAFGADDGILAFVSRSRLWVLDGKTGSLRALTWPWELAADPVFSPDGRWLSYTLDYDYEVWVARADGSDPRRVPDSAAGPASWLPTGELLTGDAFIWRTGSDGAITKVANAPSGLMAWSPDGRRYAFATERWFGPLPPHPARGVEQLSVATSLNGPRTIWLTVPLSFAPSSGMSGNLVESAVVLPRDQGIVFKTDPGLSDIANGSGIYEIRAAGATPRQIGFALALPAADTAGGEVAITDAPSRGFNRIQWMAKSVRICSAATERCTTPARARDVLTLDPAWSPNGRLLAFVEAPTSSGSEDTQSIVQDWYAAHSLWLTRRPAPTPARIAGTAGANAPTWSANGRSILYASGDSLWLLPTLSNNPVRIAGPLFQPGAWPTFYGQVDWTGQFAWLTPR